MIPSVRRRAAMPVLPFLLALPILSCDRDTGDPALSGLAAALAPGERLLQMRLLDPESPAAVAAVVRAPGGRQELRIYEREGEGPFLPRHRSRQGDRLSNLELEDLTGDGREEILATWAGGQLTILEVLTRRPDGTYATIFENGGQDIERGYAPDGGREIRVTGRTYAELEGEPPIYEITIHRYDGERFVPASH